MECDNDTHVNDSVGAKTDTDQTRRHL